MGVPGRSDLVQVLIEQIDKRVDGIEKRVDLLQAMAAPKAEDRNTAQLEQR
jgi:hypothetical protein